MLTSFGQRKQKNNELPNSSSSRTTIPSSHSRRLTLLPLIVGITILLLFSMMTIDKERNRDQYTTASLLNLSNFGTNNSHPLLVAGRNQQQQRRRHLDATIEIDTTITSQQQLPTTTISTTNIPHTLIFTYRDNILQTKQPDVIYKNILHTIDSYARAWNDGKPNVIFLTDSDCLRTITRIYPTLSPHFQSETNGVRRADICRIAALYLHGGYYFDNDIEVVEPLLLPSETSFATVIQPIRGDFFQAFVASRRGNPILRKALRVMWDVYERGTESEGLMGTRTLKRAYEMVPEKKRGGVAFLQEIGLNFPYWRKEYPTFPLREGGGCCCNYVVRDPETGVIYFYSRVVGSGHRCSFPVGSDGVRMMRDGS